jgi:hypothetical protein
LLSSGIGFGILGIFFILVAGIINITFIILLIIKIFRNKEQKRILIKTIGLILLNVPILILYCWISIIWLNTLKITFINETSADLNNIKIEGCQSKVIDNLAKGQSKTVWIKIPNDCGVSVNYRLKGIEKSEEVTGYVTNENGYSMTFKIGTSQKPYYEQDF